jgi:integrase
MLEQFFANRLAEGLSPKSIALVRGILTRAFGDAVRDGYLVRNPASLAAAPKIGGRRDDAITPAEAHAIVRAFDGHPLATLVATALGSGLRQGELLALRWEDIDLDAGNVHVGATLQRIKGEYLRLEPKTERSRRTVPLADFAMQALRKQAEDQEARRLLADSWGNTLNLVFTTPSGRPMSGSTVTSQFQARLRAAGLSVRRFHELRHGYATLLLAQGVDMRVIMELLGHTQLSMSMVYTHVVNDLQRDAARRLSELFL